MKKINKNINCISQDYNTLDLYIEKRIDLMNGDYGYKWIRNFRRRWKKHNNNINNAFISWNKFLINEYLNEYKLINDCIYTVGHYEKELNYCKQYYKG